MREISAEEARRWRLAGQGLLHRFATPEEAIRRCIAIQTQYAASLPVALAARGPAVTPEWCEKGLSESGPLRKAWTVRHTLHTHHEDDVSLLVHAFGTYATIRFERFMERRRGIAPEALREREDRIWSALREGPLDRKALHERIPELKGMPGTGWGLDAMGLAYQGRCYVKSHRGATTFVACEPPEPDDPDAAAAELLCRYLQAYAPATKHDFAYWSGLPMSRVDRAMARAGDRFETVKLEGSPKPYLMLAGASEPEGDPWPRLLAKFDPFVMSHRDKDLYLDSKHYKGVFRKAAQVEATVLVDGRIVGAWRAERAGRRIRIRIEPFGRMSKRTLSALGREAAGVGQGLGAEETEIVFD